MHILILQPQPDDGPAYLASFLHARGLDFQLCSVGAGDEVPVSAAGLDAVAMLGGAMGVNDALPWLARAEALLRDAVARGVPVLGHCLGGQMLAKALGARVARHAQPEIGWSRITPRAGPDLPDAERALVQAWLGDAPELAVYQWHQDSFALPAGATLLAGNAVCAHQAYAIGPHLGMQFHVEVDAAKLDLWCGEAETLGAGLGAWPGVQDAATMRADSARLLAGSQRLAGRIYARWLALAQAPRAGPIAAQVDLSPDLRPAPPGRA
jgi:GMP synthase-like glutamine amidotransferase